MPKPKVYFFTGLGADKRAFAKLKIPDTFESNFVDWIEPMRNETLQEYCGRLSKLIDTTGPYIFIGLSFGGIVAVEMSKITKPSKIILLSSVSNRNELPALYKLLGAIKFNKLLPALFLKQGNVFIYWLFGAKDEETKTLLKQILKDTSSNFLIWAINEIVNWKNEIRPDNIFHIHGTADNILPFKNVRADHIIDEGGHLMVFNKPEEVSTVLKVNL